MKKLVIDTKAVKSNLQTIKGRAGGSEIIADLSGNAYGLGLLETARIMRDGGIGTFAVSDPKDAAALRQAGFTDERIMMLRSTADESEIAELIDLGVICTVGSRAAAVAINGIAEAKGTVCEVQIKIDTGRGRYGFTPEEMEKVYSIYKYMANLAVVGVFSSFAASWRGTKLTEEQLILFRKVLAALTAQGFELGLTHICDSAALFNCDDCCLDAVRVGTALSGRIPGKNIPGIIKVGYVSTGIEEVNWFQKGHRVDNLVMKKPTKLAVLSVGYSHGFGVRRPEADFTLLDIIRNRRKRKYVRVNGQKARVVGSVGMMHTIIDVTNIDCTVGDVVQLDVDPICVKGLPIEYI